MQINPNVVVPNQNAILKPNPRAHTQDIPLVNPQQQLYPAQNPMMNPPRQLIPVRNPQMNNPYAHPMNRPSNMSGQNPLMGFMQPSYGGRNTVTSNNFSHNGTVRMSQNDPFDGPGNPGFVNNPVPAMYLNPNPNILNPNYDTSVGNNTLNTNFNPGPNPVPKEGDTYTVNDQKVEDYNFKQKV